jgi:hypothetical protein
MFSANQKYYLFSEVESLSLFGKDLIIALCGRLVNLSPSVAAGGNGSGISVVVVPGDAAAGSSSSSSFPEPVEELRLLALEILG